MPEEKKCSSQEEENGLNIESSQTFSVFLGEENDTPDDNSPDGGGPGRQSDLHETAEPGLEDKDAAASVADVDAAAAEAGEKTSLAVSAAEETGEDRLAGDSDNAGGAEQDDEDGEEDETTAPEEDGGLALPFNSIVEALLFASREPLRVSDIARAVRKGTRQDAVKEAINELNLHYLESGRAFEIAEISGRYQLMSRPEYVGHIRRIYPKRELVEKDKVTRLTPAALDTLSIIAYKQPVTRGEIERIRGVGCGPVLRALIERGTVKVAGKRADLVGQPLTYGTTDAFLVEFGLGSLDELPLRNEFISAFATEDLAAGAIEAADGETPPEQAAVAAETLRAADHAADEEDVAAAEGKDAVAEQDSGRDQTREERDQDENLT